MSVLSQALEDYLIVRRALGHKLEEHGRLLPDFVGNLEARDACRVTTELAVAWATQPTTSTSVWWAQRLTMVRGFAQHLQAIDPGTEVHPPGLLPYRCRRVAPHLFSDADIAALMAAARSLPSSQRAATYEALVALMAVTGSARWRSGAPQPRRHRLGGGDPDGVELQVPKEPSRPPSPHDRRSLARYARLRDELCPHPKAPSFFLSTAGTRLHISVLDRVFHGLVNSAGLEQRGERQPRPHDLRHGFAVRTLLGWYSLGVDVDAHMPLLSTFLGHSHPENTYWYLSAVPELLFLAAERLKRAGKGAVMRALAPSLETYFTERLVRQRQASPHTVAAYRDAWRLLLVFTQQRTGKEPFKLDIADLDASLIGAFLEHLETERHNTVRTRNARLAAIRSFFKFAALRHPEHANVIARVLAIPSKRCDRAEVCYLSGLEADALLASPDRDTWTGRRDRAILTMALQTGLRVSELVGLNNADLELRTGAYVHCVGKGRKERCTPLRPQTVSVMRAWIKGRPPPGPVVPDTPGHAAEPGRHERSCDQARRDGSTAPTVTVR